MPKLMASDEWFMSKVDWVRNFDEVTPAVCDYILASHCTPHTRQFTHVNYISKLRINYFKGNIFPLCFRLPRRSSRTWLKLTMATLWPWPVSPAWSASTNWSTTRRPNSPPSASTSLFVSSWRWADFILFILSHVQIASVRSDLVSFSISPRWQPQKSICDAISERPARKLLLFALLKLLSIAWTLLKDRICRSWPAVRINLHIIRVLLRHCLCDVACGIFLAKKYKITSWLAHAAFITSTHVFLFDWNQNQNRN